jgi:nucleotide-binding universal stress UspA family protein
MQRACNTVAVGFAGRRGTHVGDRRRKDAFVELRSGSGCVRRRDHGRRDPPEGTQNASTICMTSLQSILVPMDGSLASLAALEHAVTLAEDYGAKIEVLQVIPEAGAASTSTSQDGQGALDNAVERARSSLGNRLARRTATGDPLTRILDAAAEGVDLIVMGTHGHVGRLHEMLGSVAEGVVRNAPCPVLTVRDPRNGYQSFADRRHHRPSVAERPHRTSQSGR